MFNWFGLYLNNTESPGALQQKAVPNFKGIMRPTSQAMQTPFSMHSLGQLQPYYGSSIRSQQTSSFDIILSSINLWTDFEKERFIKELLTPKLIKELVNESYNLKLKGTLNVD